MSNTKSRNGPRDQLLKVLVTRAERRQIEALAQRRRLSVSSLLRDVVLQVIEAK